MSVTVIYIHGFNSSPQSIKAQQLSTYFEQRRLASRGYRLLVPALHFSPGVAIEQLVALIEACAASPILLIGSSLGGYYSIYLSQKFANCVAVLINPAVYPQRLLVSMLGEQQNLYSGEKYQLTAEHIVQLEAMDVAMLTEPKRLLLLSQMGDETLDYTEAVLKLSGVEQRVTEAGNHGYENFNAVIPELFEFAEQYFLLGSKVNE